VADSAGSTELSHLLVDQSHINKDITTLHHLPAVCQVGEREIECG